MYSLIGNIGGYNADTNTTEYINLTNGFTGLGGIFFKHDPSNGDKTDIYFGGTNNTYTGKTEIYSDVTVHLEKKDSISNSNTLILHGGANLIIDEQNAGEVFSNFDNVILMGVSTSDQTAQTKTEINGGGSTISLSGAGKQFNFFQEESILGSGSNTPDTTPDTTPETTPETPETPDTTTPEVSEDPATAEAAAPAPAGVLFAEAAASPVNTLSGPADSQPLNHHAVTLNNVKVNILNGASLMVNYLGKTIGDNTSLSDNVNDIAALILESGADMKIKL